MVQGKQCLALTVTENTVRLKQTTLNSYTTWVSKSAIHNLGQVQNGPDMS